MQKYSEKFSFWWDNTLSSNISEVYEACLSEKFPQALALLFDKIYSSN